MANESYRELTALEIKELKLFSNSLLDVNNKTKSLLNGCGIEVEMTVTVENYMKEKEVSFAKEKYIYLSFFEVI